MIRVEELIPEMGGQRLYLYHWRAHLFLFGGELLHTKNLLGGLLMCIGSGLIDEPSILLLVP